MPLLSFERVLSIRFALIQFNVDAAPWTVNVKGQFHNSSCKITWPTEREIVYFSAYCRISEHVLPLTGIPSFFSGITHLYLFASVWQIIHVKMPRHVSRAVFPPKVCGPRSVNRISIFCRAGNQRAEPTPGLYIDCRRLGWYIQRHTKLMYQPGRQLTVHTHAHCAHTHTRNNRVKVWDRNDTRWAGNHQGLFWLRNLTFWLRIVITAHLCVLQEVALCYSGYVGPAAVGLYRSLEGKYLDATAQVETCIQWSVGGEPVISGVTEQAYYSVWSPIYSMRRYRWFGQLRYIYWN